MAVSVYCNFCLTRKWMRWKWYKKNLVKFNCSNVIELDKKYRCKKCRDLFKKLNPKSSVVKSKEFEKLKNTLQEEVNLYLKRGLNNMDARNNFMSNVKSILDKNHVYKYDYIVKGTELIGILLKDVIFVGEILLPLKGN